MRTQEQIRQELNEIKGRLFSAIFSPRQDKELIDDLKAMKTTWELAIESE